MRYLTKRQILRLDEKIIETSGGTRGVRDQALLDSALNAPFQTFESRDLYPSIVSKAVRLGYGLLSDHPFVDGNKRIGIHAMLVFLDINQTEITYDDKELIDIILQVASGELSYESASNPENCHP